MGHKKVRVVLYEESGWWVAQCLEYDIRVQAKTMPQVQENIAIALEATWQDSKDRHGKPFAHVNPAPEEFERMWKGRTASVPPRTLQQQHPMVPEYRPMSLALA